MADYPRRFIQTAPQRQTKVSDYLSREQLLLFAFLYGFVVHIQTAVTAYFPRKQLLLFVFVCRAKANKLYTCQSKQLLLFAFDLMLSRKDKQQ